jgi:hypothetical protein
MRRLLCLLPAALLVLTLAACDAGTEPEEPSIRRFDYVDTLSAAVPADPMVVVLEAALHDYEARLPPLTARTREALRDSVRLVLSVEAWDDTEAPNPAVTLRADADSLVLWYARDARDDVIGSAAASASDAHGSGPAKTAPVPPPNYRIVSVTVEVPAGVAFAALCGRAPSTGRTTCRTPDA